MAPSARVAVVTGSGSGAPTRSSSAAVKVPGGVVRGNSTRNALGAPELRIGGRHVARAGGRAASEQQRHAGIAGSAQSGRAPRHPSAQAPRRPAAAARAATCWSRALPPGPGRAAPSADPPASAPSTEASARLSAPLRAASTVPPPSHAPSRDVAVSISATAHSRTCPAPDRRVRHARAHGHRRPQVLQARQRRRHGAERRRRRVCPASAASLRWRSSSPAVPAR